MSQIDSPRFLSRRALLKAGISATVLFGATGAVSLAGESDPALIAQAQREADELKKRNGVATPATTPVPVAVAPTSVSAEVTTTPRPQSTPPSAVARSSTAVPSEYSHLITVDPNASDEDFTVVKYPYKSPYPTFSEYTAPFGTITVPGPDGVSKWVRTIHEPWKTKEWGPMYAPAAESRGLIMFHQEKIGALALYVEAYKIVTGRYPEPNPRELAESAAEKAKKTQSLIDPKVIPSLGHCPPLALATALEKKPNESWSVMVNGRPFQLGRRTLDGILVASYGHYVPVAPRLKEPGTYTDEDIAVNKAWTRQQARAGRGKAVFDVVMRDANGNEVPGFWGRTWFSELEDGSQIEVTKFEQEFETVDDSKIQWASIGWHPNGPVPVDMRLTRMWEDYDYHIDQRFMRHLCFGHPLPANFPNF